MTIQKIRASIKRENEIKTNQVAFFQTFRILTEDGNILDAENSNDIVYKHATKIETVRSTLKKQNQIESSVETSNIIFSQLKRTSSLIATVE